MEALLELNKGDRLALITKLIKLAKSDNYLHFSEIMLIKPLSLKLGIKDADFIELLRDIKPDDEFSEPESYRNKVYFFYYLIRVMHADGYVHPNEKYYCNRAALRLGLSVPTSQFIQSNHNLPFDMILTETKAQLTRLSAM